jgi:hypothetical protein
VVSVAVCAPWARCARERAFSRDATPQLRAAFAGLRARSPCKRRMRQTQDLLVAVGHGLTGHVGGEGCADAVLASPAVVTRNAQRRATGWLVGQAARGWSTRVGWEEGLHLLSAVPPEGVSTGSGCAPASTAEQRLAATVRAARTGAQPRVPAVGRRVGGGDCLAATTCEGNRWGPHGRSDDGALVRCAPTRHQPFPFAWSRVLRRRCAGLRTLVATVQAKLLLPVALAQPRPPSLAGRRARLAATVALHTACC